jgi:hypothetical protein
MRRAALSSPILPDRVIFKKRLAGPLVVLGLTATLGTAGVRARTSEPPADIKTNLRTHGAQSITVASPVEAPVFYAFLDFMKARLQELFPRLATLPAIDVVRVDRLNDISNFAGACDRKGETCGLIMTDAALRLPAEQQRAGLAHELSHIVIERQGVESLLTQLPLELVAPLVRDLSAHIHTIRDYIDQQTPFPEERTEMYNYIAGAQTEEILTDAMGKLILCDGEILKTMIDSPVDLPRQIADATRRYMQDKDLPESGKERFQRRFEILKLVMHHPGGKDRKRFVDLIDLESAPGCQSGSSR